jgi:hypothetical protein
VHPTRRARRFALRLEVWYRPIDDAQWRRGTTHSVSATGAVVETSKRCASGDQIIIVIALQSAGCLVGRGRVVSALRSGSSVVFSAAVEHFRIEHRDTAMRMVASESSDGASPRGDLRVISPPL